MVVADILSGTTCEADGINERLMIKISSQAKQLAEMNEDICAAAEYIKLCESRLKSYESAEVVASSKRGACERMQIDCEDSVEKLEEKIRSKDQLYICSEKKVAELSKDLRSLQYKLQNTQDSLRLANFLAGPKTAAHQTKMAQLSSSENIDYRAEINQMRMKLGSAKEKERVMTVKVTQLEESLAAQSRHVQGSDRNMMSMKLTKQDQQTEKQTTENRNLNRLEIAHREPPKCDADESVKAHNDIESYADSAYMIEIKKREDKISFLEGSVRRLEDNLLAAGRELKRFNSSGIDLRIEVLEDERDTLLEFIQVDLTKNSEKCAELELNRLDLESCRKSLNSTEERERTTAESLRSAQERVAMLSADIDNSQHRIKLMKAQRREEIKEVSIEAKKDADIISNLSAELKEARAKIFELSEAQQKGFDVAIIDQILADASAVIEVPQKDGGGFDKSRRQTIELVSLRRANEQWMSRRCVASKCVDGDRILNATARAVKALAVDFNSLNLNPRSFLQTFPERARNTPITPTGGADHGTKGYGFRYSRCGEDRGGSDPGYMRNRSWRSRSPRKGRHAVPSIQSAMADSNSETQGDDCTAAEPLHQMTSQSCPLSDEHMKWINLITVHRMPVSLSNNIKIMADDLLYLEVKCALLLERLKATCIDGRDQAQILDEVRAAAAGDIDHAEMELKLRQSESRNGRDVGAIKILEEVVSALLDAPMSVLNVKCDWPAASPSPLMGTGDPKVLTQESTDSLRANRVTHQNSQETQHLEGRVALSQPTGIGSNGLQGDVQVASSSRITIPLHRLPDMIRELIATASRYHSRAGEAEALLSPALSDLQAFRSNLRISRGELEYTSSKMEEMVRKNKTAREDSLEVEKVLRRELECAADLAELQNRMIAEAKKEAEIMAREKHMSSAQLTAKCLKEEDTAVKTLSLLSDFSLQVGLHPDSVGFEAFTSNMEGVLECVSNMLSKLADHRHDAVPSTEMLMGATERRLYPHRYDRNSPDVNNKSLSSKVGDVDLLRISVLSKSLQRMGSGLGSQLGIDPLTPITPMQYLLEATTKMASTEDIARGPSRMHRPAVHLPSNPLAARGNEMSSSEFVRYLKSRRRKQNDAVKNPDLSTLTG